MSAEPAEASKVRWRLDIGYDGTNFSGWAAQAGRRTVQGELERWMTRVLRLDVPAHLVCAGRTDAGVHARGQVAHVDLGPTVITDGGQALTRRLNKVLGGDCVVHRISAAPPGFDARFAAIWRRYVYRLSDGDVPPGSVLVVSHLDPRLAPVIPRLAGLVAETGSPLSHLAILAREYGVPTVVTDAWSN